MKVTLERKIDFEVDVEFPAYFLSYGVAYKYLNETTLVLADPTEGIRKSTYGNILLQKFLDDPEKASDEETFNKVFSEALDFINSLQNVEAI